eukprot:COSAG01_NODE_5761_length_4048_cov_8.447962_8_plen_253_part_00
MTEYTAPGQEDTALIDGAEAPAGSADGAPAGSATAGGGSVLKRMFTMPPARQALREIFLIDPPHFLTLNIAVTVIHVWLVVVEWLVVVPLAGAALAWTDLGFIRIAWLAVFFSFFMYWFSFFLYAEHTTAQKATYNGSVPRNNNLKATNLLSMRLWGAHQNAIEFMGYFTGAVACACCVGDLTVVEEGGAETSKNKEVAAFAIMAIFARIVFQVGYTTGVSYVRGIGYVMGLHATTLIYLGALFNVWTGWAL